MNKRKNISIWFAKFKATLECIECGENHPACLTFHHKDPSKKHKDISRMVSTNYSMKSILMEVAKCDCICANCHAKKHWKDSKYQSKVKIIIES